MLHGFSEGAPVVQTRQLLEHLLVPADKGGWLVVALVGVVVVGACGGCVVSSGRIIIIQSLLHADKGGWRWKCYYYNY